MPGQVFVAADSGALEFEGAMVVVHKGVTRVREGHELLRKYPDMFKPLDVHYDVEDTTARPGAKRGGRRSEKTDED